MIGGSGNFQRFINLTLDCSSQASSRAASYAGSNTIWDSVTVKNCTTRGLLLSGNGNIIRNSVFTSNAGISIDVSTIGHMVIGSVFYANTATPISDSSGTASGLNSYTRNVFANNLGATTDGMTKSGASGLFFHGNLLYANGRDGLRISGVTAADSVSIRNNIIWGNAAIGLNIVATNWSSRGYWTDINYNGIGGNATDRVNAPIGSNDVALSTDPTTNGAAYNFTLNSTPGGGAALKAVGSPGALPIGGAGNLDIGPLQSLAVSASGGTRTCAQ